MTGAAADSIEFWAREKPNATAIIEGDKVLTWRAWKRNFSRASRPHRIRNLKAA